MLLTAFGGVASAAVTKDSNGWWYDDQYPGSAYGNSEQIPVAIVDEWAALSGVTATKQTTEYFIISTKAGAHEEELYISMPATGGVRIQSLHELQKEAGETKPLINNDGLFEQKTRTMTYRPDGDDVVMVGVDGTVVRFVKKSNGFELQLSNQSERIINITNEQITFGYDQKGNVISQAFEMPLIEHEAIVGGGERFNDTNQVGRKFSLVNVDSPSTDAYSYNNIPLFHSNRGYSVWFNMTGIGKADIGATNAEKYTIRYDQSQLDVTLWAGMPLENLKKYTDITGRSGVYEEWAYGFWIGASEAAYQNTKLKNQYANLQALIEGYKEHYNFYPEGCYGEGTNGISAQPLTYTNTKDIKMFMWYNPWYGSYKAMADVLPNMPAEPQFDAQGNITSTGWPNVFNPLVFDTYGLYRIMRSDNIDWTNPAAADYVKSFWGQWWEWGQDGAMLDFGELGSFDTMYYNGKTGKEMRNLYSYYYAKVVAEGWTEEKGNDFVLFQRSGTIGSQKYVGNFLGDQYATYEYLLKTINAMVNLGASGFNQYGADMGALLSKPSNDLWNRWVVSSVFSPFMRQHGTNLHMPWVDYDELAAATFGHYYYFRKNLVPTLLSASMDANQTANPIMKGMIAAYPYQMPLADLNHQYLFCDDFLVSTVTMEETWFQQTALPKGSTWYNLYTYEAFAGGQIIFAEAPTSTMPVFVKGGAVKAINLPESMKLGEEMHDESVDEYQPLPSLLITPPDAERTTTIYVKDGKSEDFQTYDYHTEVYTSKPVDETAFTITNEDGSDREIVLALGVTAAEIKVDGETLTRLDHMPDYFTYEYGYYVDPQGMTTILLPAGWNELSIVKGDGKYDEVETISTDVVANALDGNPGTAYQLSLKGDPMVVELKEAAEISRVEVNWAVGYYGDYDLEYSMDGENWYILLSDPEDAYTVEGGLGSVDVVEFAPVTAKYVRLYPANKSEDVTVNPAVYEFEVYAPYVIEEDIPVVDPDEEEDEDIGSETDNWTDEEFEDWEGYGDEDELDDEEEDGTTQQVIKKRKKLVSYGNGFPWWIIIIIGAVVLVLGGLLLLFLLLRRKKKKAEEALESAEESPTDFPDLPTE